MSDSPGRLVPLTGMRRSIAKAMTLSAGVPQFSIERDVDASRLMQRRGVIGVTDLLVAACARTLRSHRRLNASFTPEGILEYDRINVGLATNLNDGLIAPAIMDADRLSLSAIASERDRLTRAAHDGRLRPEEVLNTTFTISNLGTAGVRRFRALVVPPQAAILAVGVITADMKMGLCLSCDHRVVDGLPAALFLKDLVASLEDPGWLLPNAPANPDALSFVES